MIMQTKSILSLLLLLICTDIQNIAGSSWSYTNPETSSKHWAEEGFKQCGGAYQSPINIDSSNTQLDSNLKKIRIIRDDNVRSDIENYKVTNNGHTLKIDFPKNLWGISLGNDDEGRYKVLQMHFHWGNVNNKGSEHTLDGKSYEMESHLVAYDSRLYSDYADASKGPYGHVVLGFWSTYTPSVEPKATQLGIMNQLNEKLKQGIPVNSTVEITAFDLSKLLEQVDPKSYYRYVGSLTTPPCTQNVIWTLFKTPVPILENQLSLLRNLPFGNNEDERKMSNNFRPVLPLNPEEIPVPRIVYRSHSSHSLANSFILLCVYSIWLTHF